MTQDSSDDKAMVQQGEGGSLTAFLTAGAGALGESLTRRLSGQGHRVYVTVDTAADAQRMREAGGFPTYVDLTRGSEIASALRMAKPDVIVHTAAQLPNGLPYRSGGWDTAHMTASAAALVEAVQAIAAEAGEAADDAEAVAPVPFIVYPGYAFVEAEGDNDLLQAAVDAEATLRESGLAACILRMGFLYGPHMPATRDFAETLRAGRPITAGEGHANWLHMEDAAAALAAAVVRQPAGAVLHVTGDEPATTYTFMSDFADEMGLQLPEGILLRLGRLFTGKDANLLLGLDVQVDNSAAKTTLDWQPQYPTHRAGIAQTLLIWRAEGAAEQT